MEETWPATVAEAREAACLAASSGAYDAIVASGGDGTIRHVAAGLIGTSMPLGIIPMGTGNVLAHEIGLRARAEDIAEMLLSGPVVTANVARANGEPFLLMAGVGVDARIVAALDERLKARAGRMAYAPAILRALSHPVDMLTVDIDGVKHAAAWVIVTNAAHYGGRFMLAPQTHVTRPELQVVLFHARSRVQLAQQMTALALGRMAARCADPGDIQILPCRTVTVTSGTPVATQLDGDVFGTTPLRVEAATDALQLIVPR